jgi:hypothetical protein
MLDRQKVEAILSRRFHGAAHDQVAAAANAIMGLSEEWEEVLHDDKRAGYHFSNECGNVCCLVDNEEQSVEFRLFRRRGN